ncbi:hypothetical protein QR98_0034310 [Sarcoptes scabiei]|uniref:Uncharacterized protein n=1 Tax=Sarcoptes scabiei TaxID=52283 RepID=A0A132A209_SARSC|nr:hypothetical protein QR98_0034310 [Sarcoptes scabiei]
MQANVGPTIAPGSGFSDVPAMNRSTSSILRYNLLKTSATAGLDSTDLKSSNDLILERPQTSR